MFRIRQSFASADAAKAYFDKSLAHGDYYAQKGEIVGKWGGRGAEHLGLLGQEVTRDVFHALCDGKTPTGQKLTARKNNDANRIVGYDIVGDSVKAFSALWALTQDKALETMFTESFNETMTDIEKRIMVRVRGKQDIKDIIEGRVPGFCKQIKCRSKKGKEFYRKEYFRHSNNICYGSFMHFTSRPVEDKHSGKTIAFPQVHIHGFTFNATYDEHASPRKKGQAKGVWKAGNFSDIKACGNYFNARFQARLTKRLVDAGYAVERTGKDWTLTGVPDTLIEKFSQRTKLIEAEAKRLGIKSAKEKDELGARTRQGKEQGLPMHELFDVWWNEVADEGERKAMEHVAHQLGGRPKVLNQHEREQEAMRAMDHAIEHSFERESVIAQTQLVQNACQAGYGSVLPEDIDRQLQRQTLIRREKNLRTMVTTTSVIEEEKSLLEFVRNTQGTCRRLHPGEYVFMKRVDANGQPWELNDQQKQAAMQVLTSNDRVMIIRGAAGTGKSTTLEDIKRACDEQGQQVHGFAPTTEATHGLADKGFVGASTVQMLLVNPEVQRRVENGVILVDEAGLLSVPQLRSLCDLAQSQHARLLLVGDRRQHHSVERGDSLALLEDYGGIEPAQITKMMRQRANATYKDITQAVEEQRYLDALSMLEVEGSVGKVLDDGNTGAFVQDSSEEKLFWQMAQDAVALRLQGHSVIVDTPINRNGEIISQHINSLLEEKGLVKKRGMTVDRLRTAGLTRAQRKDATQYQPGQVVCVEKNLPKLSRRGFTLPGTQAPEEKIGNLWYRQRDIKRGEKLEVIAKYRDEILVKDRHDKTLVLPLKHAARFDVFNKQEMKVTGGRKIRFRRGGKTKEGHQIVNGRIYTVDSVTRAGNVRLSNGWEIERDWGHWTYGDYGTSHMNQGSDADFVLQDQTASAFGATHQTQFYVSVTRGKKGVRIYTDRKEELHDRVQLSNARMSATELLAERDRHEKVNRLRDYARQRAECAVKRLTLAGEAAKNASAKAIEEGLAWARRAKLRLKDKKAWLGRAGEMKVTADEAAQLAPQGITHVELNTSPASTPASGEAILAQAASAFAHAGVTADGKSSVDTRDSRPEFSKEERNQPNPKRELRPEKDPRSIVERYQIKPKGDRSEILSNRWDIRQEQLRQRKAANDQLTRNELQTALEKLKKGIDQ